MTTELEELRITSLGKFAHGYVIYEKAAINIINKLENEIDCIESKLTIARDFIQELRNDTPTTCEWDNLDKTLEAIK